MSMIRAALWAVLVAVLITCGCEGIEKRPGLLDVVFAKPGPELQVMTFNIRYGTAPDGENAWEKRRSLLLATIKARNPEVLCLQEALRGQIDEIREAIPEYAEAGVARDDGKTKGEYAAILYRRDALRLENEKTFWFSETPDVPGSIAWGAKLPRICTFALLADRSSGRMLHVFNVHLDHQSARSRTMSAQLLAEAVLQTRMPGVPAVICGDFNEGEGGPVVFFLTGKADRATDEARAARAPSPGMADTFRIIRPSDNGVGTYHAFTGRREGEKIDFVLVDRDVPIVDAGIDHTSEAGRYPSDHFAVWARIRIGR